MTRLLFVPAVIALALLVLVRHLDVASREAQ